MNLGNRFSQHSFAQTPQANIPRSRFDRSFATKDTFKFDYLNPIFIDRMVPGDSVNLNVKAFLRLAPQVRPIMDNMKIDFLFFSVPDRLVWDNFQKYMGEQRNPGDSTDYLVPQIRSAAKLENGSIYDKFGLPTDITPETPRTINFDARPLRAYNLCFNEWLRDQNLEDSLNVPTGDGPDTPATYKLVKSNKQHDYFTSALPWTQKGAPVTIPLGQTAPVIGNNQDIGMRVSIGGTYVNEGTLINAADIIRPSQAALWGNNTALRISTENSGMIADLTSATAATINQLRQAFMLQSLFELDARGGTRYTEIIRSHFGVLSPDQRLQRPELLSISRIMIDQHPIAQNSASTDESPQGNLAAFSTASEFGNKIGFSKSFVEHTWVIGIMRARSEITYQQGMNRMWTMRTKYDEFWPKFLELGEQTVYNYELFYSGKAIDDDAFGFQERYAQMRYYPSMIKGQFRSNYAESLDVWHQAQEFTETPTLSKDFIESNSPIGRALTVPDENYPDLLADFFFEYKHARPMTTYGVPATLGRF